MEPTEDCENSDDDEQMFELISEHRSALTAMCKSMTLQELVASISTADTDDVDVVKGESNKEDSSSKGDVTNEGVVSDSTAVELTPMFYLIVDCFRNQYKDSIFRLPNYLTTPDMVLFGRTSDLDYEFVIDINPTTGQVSECYGEAMTYDEDRIILHWSVCPLLSSMARAEQYAINQWLAKRAQATEGSVIDVGKDSDNNVGKDSDNNVGKDSS